MRSRQKDVVIQQTFRWHPLPLNATAGWVYYGAAPWEQPMYGKDEADWVHLRGLIKNANVLAGSQILGTVPIGYRIESGWPNNTWPVEIFYTYGGVSTTGSVPLRVDVDAAGNITYILIHASQSVTYLTLDGIRWRAARTREEGRKALI